MSTHAAFFITRGFRDSKRSNDVGLIDKTAKAESDLTAGLFRYSSQWLQQSL